VSGVFKGACGDYAGNCGWNSADDGSDPQGYNGQLSRGVLVCAKYTNDSNWNPTKWTPRTTIKSIVDGTSSTLLAGERHVSQSPSLGSKKGFGWVESGDGSIYNTDNSGLNICRIAGADGIHSAIPIARSPTDPFNYQFGSYHAGICQFVFCDGAVRPIGINIDNVNLGRLACKDDQQVITYPISQN
jgi:hypothetical protein